MTIPSSDDNIHDRLEHVIIKHAHIVHVKLMVWMPGSARGSGVIAKFDNIPESERWEGNKKRQSRESNTRQVFRGEAWSWWPFG